MEIGRRKFLGLGAGVFALAVTETSCGLLDPGSPSDARIDAPPRTPRGVLLEPGRHDLDMGSSRDGFIYVPSIAANGAAVPLLLLLHGAGGAAANWNTFIPQFESRGFAVVAPDSRRDSWDYRYGGFGPDIRFIEDSLRYAFESVNVIPERIAIAGFSDGATYCLSVGLTNGDLFRNIMAFSPSAPVMLEARGKPPIYITHGEDDPVLPFEYTRDITVPMLRDRGYTLVFDEFAGGHTVPIAKVSAAFSWWLT